MDYPFQSIGPALRLLVLVFLLVFAVLVVALIVFMAILPGQIAKSRSHPQAEAIAICGWVGLPTGILWAIALVWAFIRPSTATTSAEIPTQAMARLGHRINALERSIAAFEANPRQELRP